MPESSADGGAPATDAAATSPQPTPSATSGASSATAPTTVTASTNNAPTAAGTAPTAPLAAPPVGPASAPTAPPINSGALATETVQPAISPAAALPEPRRASLTRARLRLLDASFAGLAARSSSQRILDGIVAIGAGAVMAGSTFVIPATTGGTDIRLWLWATSGYLGLQGIVNLAWAPARERMAREYEALPVATAAQRRARMRFGEHALDEIAADGQRRRILAGIANIAATGGLLTVAYSDAIFNGAPHTFSLTDAVVLTYGGVAVILHVVQMLSQSEEERLRNAYFQQLQMLRAERTAPANGAAN